MSMYAIAGATGKTGSAAADALLSQGAQVRVIVRAGARGDVWRARGAEVAVADLRDADALAMALREVDGAYLLVPTDPGVPDLAEDQGAITAGISAAVAQARVPHVVLLSSVGAEIPAGTGPIAGLHAAERALRRIAGVTTTALRSVYLMENFAGALGMLEQHILPTFLPEDLCIDMVSARDVGVAAAQLLSQGPRGAGVVYAMGPQQYSYREAAAILSQIVQEEVRVQRMPMDAMVPVLTGAGFSPSLAAAYREMTDAQSQGLIRPEAGAERITGSTQLETVLRSLLSAGAPIHA